MSAPMTAPIHAPMAGRPVPPARSVAGVVPPSVPALTLGVLLAAGVLAGPAPAQAQAPAAEPVLEGKTPEWLVGTAVLAAPESLREGAEVRAWTSDDRLVTLRTGDNGIICLADRPGDGKFSAACYHAGLEPFMERGRELRREGIDGMARNEARWKEIEEGALPMPAGGMVYNLGFPTEDVDPTGTDPATGGRLHALYLRGATAESTGLPTTPGDGPWLMFPGTPSAHVMIGLPAKSGG